MGEPAKTGICELIPIIVLNLIILTGHNSFGQVPTAQSQIVRVTHSKDAVVKYPSLSHDGLKLLYLSEERDPSDPEKRNKSFAIINVDGGGAKVLFSDNTIKAPAPYGASYLVCGTRPPQLSGDGSKAVFSVTIEKPFFLPDHYLGVINTDGTGWRLHELENEVLTKCDWQRKGFKDDTWDRISNYAVSNDGNKIMLIVKGHHGLRKLGIATALITMLSDGSKQRALIAPVLDKEGWVWKNYPSKPCTEGGWAFAFSGNGEKILFGAQSSADKDDYDLYLINWDGSGLKKVTNFRDRFFTMADLSDDGGEIVFFYSGEKQNGVGTYSVHPDGTGLEYLQSRLADRIVFEDLDPSGKKIVYRHNYLGIVMNLESKSEKVILHPKTPGYASSNESFMDFPYCPSFWEPNIMAGNNVIITGIPEGGFSREFFLLTIAPSDVE